MPRHLDIAAGAQPLLLPCQVLIRDGLEGQGRIGLPYRFICRKITA
jgi:hypothetical protein